MSGHTPIPYPAHQWLPEVHFQPTQDSCQALVRLATIGAVVGASAAAAKSIRQVQSADVTPTQALVDTGKAALITGAASAVAGAAAGAISGEGVTRLAVLFAAGTAVMYAVGRHLEPDDASTAG